MPEPAINLYLVGFMGTGKTTVGRAIAQRLGFQALDSDYEIERLAGKTVAQIFAEEGEVAFRARERAFVDDGHPGHGVVVACGGGLIVPPGMLELLRAKGVVICLHATVGTILQRTAATRTRPLLNVDDPEARIRQLYAERETIYQRAGTVILTDSRPLHDVVLHVLRTYRREVRDWGRGHGSVAPRVDRTGAGAPGPAGLAGG